MEAWLLQNEPPDICTQASERLWRYKVSSLIFPKDVPPEWSIGAALDHSRRGQHIMAP